MAAATHFNVALRHRQRVARPPVAGGVDPDPLPPVTLDDVHGPLGSALAVGVERHPGPEAGIEHGLDRMLFDVVDQHPARIDRGIPQGSENQAGALELVFKMGRMDQDQLIVATGDLDLLLENHELVARILVQPDLSDAEHIRAVEKLGDQRHHLPSKAGVLRLFGVDAEPAIVRDSIAGSPLRLGIGQLAEVVEESSRRGTVEPGPEGRLRHRDAARLGHPRVVVRRPADHVDVRVDIGHRAGGSRAGESGVCLGLRRGARNWLPELPACGRLRSARWCDR